MPLATTLMNLITLWAVLLASLTSVEASQQLPCPTYYGFLNISDGAMLHFTYYEASAAGAETPVLLWLQVWGASCGREVGPLVQAGCRPSPLAPETPPVASLAQGGPGCASSFGSLYELGPHLVTPSLELVPNPGRFVLAR